MVKNIISWFGLLPLPLRIVVVGLAFFIPFLGKVHLFDWDEVNFAESAREMLLTGNYLTVQINFQPFWEKPPLFFWLQALSMYVFGVSEFAARLPNALVGVINLLVLYLIGRRLYGVAFGWLWALAWLGSFTPHLYAKSGIIDPTFNLFMMLSIWQGYEYLHKAGASTAMWAGAAAGMAVLTKGPVGVLIPGLVFVSLWVWHRFARQWAFGHALLAVGVCVAVSALWFVANVWQNGWGIVEQFVAYQVRLLTTPDAGHSQPFFYHFVVVLLGCFPVSILAVKYLFQKNILQKAPTPVSFAQVMVCVFWVVMIIFSIVRTKIVHYSSMVYYPVTFFGAYFVHEYLLNRNAWPRATVVAFLVVGSLLAVALTAVPLIGMYSYELVPYIQDRFAAANLQAPVSWAGWEWLIGVGYGLGLWYWGLRHQIVPILWLTACCLLCYTAVVLPKIEGYVQATAIDFYEAHQGQDVYIETLGFKSYAHLYYFAKAQPLNIKSYDEQWLLNGPVDKPTYFVCRNIDAQDFRYNPNLQLIKEENGFVFFKRKRDE
jgi:4-amino-4-deoxy-L-arabinose transferase-like glycosyltransferase